MKKINIIFILVLFTSSNLLAIDPSQNDSSYYNNGYWLGLGIGNNYFGPNLCATLSFSKNENLFTFKYSKSKEFIFVGVENNSDNPSLEIAEYSLLYGRTFRKDILLFNVSAGLSYLKGINRGNNILNHQYEQINISTIGFPFEAEAMFEFTKYFGAGILFYGNINKDKTYGGGMLRIKFGWF